MKRFLLALLWGLSLVGGAMAQQMPAFTEFGACVTTLDPSFATQGFGRLRCDVNGNLLITGISGGGGGGGNAAVTSNATDGQATSTTNQQNVTYNYLFNGSTWDRMRGTGGSANVIVTNTPSVNIGTTGGLALDSTVSGLASTNSAINTATGTTADAATASGANSTIIGALRAIRDKLLGTLTTTVSSSALPTGASTSANQTTEIASLAAIQQRAVTFAEANSTAVAASSTTTGTTRDVGANPLYSRFNIFIVPTQSGTLVLQGSNDNFTTPVNVSVTPVTAGTSTTVISPVMFRYNRYQWINGTTAGSIIVNTSYTAN